MQSPEASIHCPNPSCQALNPESHQFCQQCRTPIPRQYLWGVGADLVDIRPGDLLVGRYLCKHSQVFLDTQPGFLPDAPNDLSVAMEPYLRLVFLQPRVPQVYAILPSIKNPGTELLLLEQAPIYPQRLPNGARLPSQDGALMPTVDESWPTAIALRQLNWLWQVVQLWPSLKQQRVAQTLLNPTALRAEGGIVRVLELHNDPTADLTLADLGRFWERWVPTANSAIADFLAALCDQLEQGQIQTPEHLEQILDEAIWICGQGQQRELRAATLTDKGPVRQRNEDACFPPSGSFTTLPLVTTPATAIEPLPPIVVCDGIGGHEGGNIASTLAIETVQQQLQFEPNGAIALTPPQLTNRLEASALAANDVIFQRNDAERRHERQRMGTTLVMALGHGPQLYITHVGDSRAYRITPSGCHQVTVDDDLATREVRLGYALYRQALRQPSSGSLVQALGMSASTVLHPTVQRFIIDDDCLYLLCSDGLSDNNRVEQHWQTVLLPVLEGKVDLTTAAQELVAIANEQNGHDNVTVGLVHCRMTSAPSGGTPIIAPELALQPALPEFVVTKDTANSLDESTIKTQTMKPPARPRRNLFRLLLVLGLIGAVGSGLTYLLITGFEQLSRSDETANPSQTPSPASPIAATPTLTPGPSSANLSVGARLLVNRANPNGNATAPILLSPQQPGLSPAPNQPVAGVPVGSVLEVVSQQRDRIGQNWVRVKVCSLAQTATTAPVGVRDVPTQTVQAGDLGWVQAEAIAPFITTNVSLTNAQLGFCLQVGQPGQTAAPSPRSP